MKKKLVVLTGAGVSAESGVSTFRDSNGLWENHKVEDVASIEGWYRNPSLVLEFYNERRLQLSSVRPNAAHFAIAELEKDWDVTVITQNVDNLQSCVQCRKLIICTMLRVCRKLDLGGKNCGYHKNCYYGWTVCR